MNSSPENQHFISEQKEKSAHNFRTFMELQVLRFEYLKFMIFELSHMKIEEATDV